jgi:hypothetical protein
MKRYNLLTKKYAMESIPLENQINLVETDKNNLSTLLEALNAYAEKLPGDKQPVWLIKAIKEIKHEHFQTDESATFLTRFSTEIQTELNKAAYDTPKTDDPYDTAIAGEPEIKIMHDEDEGGTPTF